ncbi:hypothetical protein DVR12_17825 [Chitinophaga silvatica]|uniref:Uncharacterized protein n=1 Tax=Chitinophaga silvatica TaxID=2282649 RepID=A0A3E1Y851_9BACT|nr:hypothetical protein [Chitinophaga silvatica]RFS21193.1 hypothetical protein DVR12_17825 [Chitinophaga silvatica]
MPSVLRIIKIALVGLVGILVACNEVRHQQPQSAIGDTIKVQQHKSSSTLRHANGGAKDDYDIVTLKSLIRPFKDYLSMTVSDSSFITENGVTLGLSEN